MATQDNSPGAEDADTLIMHTTDIVVSFVANNSIGAQEVSSLIQNVHATLARLGSGNIEEPRPEPAVSVRASAKNDHIVCLEDGKKFKMLKRHLMTDHDLTPAEYRARWDLPASYPMVAPAYAALRGDLARKIGLGRKPGEKPGAKKAAAKKPAAKTLAAKGRTKNAASPRKSKGAANGPAASAK
jgi:predicted transcriptional regulator